MENKMLNFKISELIYSDTAIRYNINNMPDINSLDNLLELIFYVLQPLRDKLGKPIKITSGYRCSQINRIVGGAVDKYGRPKSQHCFGQAADIIVKNMSTDELAKFIINSGIEYDQLINEKTWIHISYVKGKNRKQYLSIC